MFITSERLILLDTQPVMSLSVLDELVQNDRERRHGTGGGRIKILKDLICKVGRNRHNRLESDKNESVFRSTRFGVWSISPSNSVSSNVRLAHVGLSRAPSST